MQLRKVEAGGLSFEIAEAGAANDRRVLLVHGFTGAKDDFVDAVDRLADAGWHAVARVLQDEHAAPLDAPAAWRLRAERAGWEEFERRKFLASSAAMWAAMAPKMLNQADRLDRLATLSVPTLVIVGEQDKPFVGPSQRMAK